MSWQCSVCGQSHEDVPLSFAADYPDNYANLSEALRVQAVIGSDQCVIDEKEYYIRGLLELPIQGRDEKFLWGVWASLWPEDYEEISESWEEVGREERRGPYKGRLANVLPAHPPSTANLKLTVKLEPVGQRPLFFIDDISHPLATLQREGVTQERLEEILATLLHPMPERLDI